MEKKENKIIEKPGVVKYRECKEALINTINSYQLPAFLMESIVRELLNEIVASSELEYRNAIMEYQSQLMSANTTEEKTENTEKKK